MARSARSVPQVTRAGGDDLRRALVHHRRRNLPRTIGARRVAQSWTSHERSDAGARCDLLGNLSGVAEPDETIRPDTDVCPGARRPVHVLLGKIAGGSLVGHPNHDER